MEPQCPYSKEVLEWLEGPDSVEKVAHAGAAAAEARAGANRSSGKAVARGAGGPGKLAANGAAVLGRANAEWKGEAAMSVLQPRIHMLHPGEGAIPCSSWNGASEGSGLRGNEGG